MPLDFALLKDQPRVLMEVKLKPLQGTRFQPTGFPDLGAGTYKGFGVDGVKMDCILVESAQSMANRLEMVCWDEATEDLVKPLKGLPYVRSVSKEAVTDSIREAHRLNSPYIAKANGFATIEKEIGYEQGKPFDRRKLASALFKYDPSSLLHGIFLEKIGGVVRLPRTISAFIEAEEYETVSLGGVKLDRVRPETKKSGKADNDGDSADKKAEGGGKTAKEGFGNVPYHRDEYTSKRIIAYFNIDLAQIRGYGFDDQQQNLLIALSCYKIQKFLHEGLKLRTACDLETIGSIQIKRPEGFKLPELKDLEKELPKLIEANATKFSAQRIFEVKYQDGK